MEYSIHVCRERGTKKSEYPTGGHVWISLGESDVSLSHAREILNVQTFFNALCDI